MLSRIATISRLSTMLLKESEPIQVLQYGLHGHYHAHYDSQGKVDTETLSCCHLNKEGKCKLCRLFHSIIFQHELKSIIHSYATIFRSFCSPNMFDVSRAFPLKYLNHGLVLHMNKLVRNKVRVPLKIVMVIMKRLKRFLYWMAK